jgi:hypothetical protein
MQQAGPLERLLEQVRGERAGVPEPVEVVRHATAHRVRADPVLSRVVRLEQPRVPCGERFEAQLPGAPAVELAGEDLVLEEGELVAGEDEHDREPPPGRPPPLAEHRLQLGGTCGEQLELVEHDEGALLADEPADRGQRSRPALERLGCEQLVARYAHELSAEVPQLVRRHRVGRLDVQRSDTCREVGEQLGLPDPASPVDDEQLGVAAVHAGAELGHLVDAVPTEEFPALEIPSQDQILHGAGV